MVYLDTCLVIYLVENHTVFAPIIERHILHTDVTKFAISPLVKAEALVLPFRKNNNLLIEKYQDFFSNIEMLPMAEIIFTQSAQLRAKYPHLKTPDALHLSTAQYHNCSAFWTCDARLQRVIDHYVVNICSHS